MGMLWKLFKIVIALALAIPLSIIVLATALGVLGALMGLAVLTLKLAVVGLVGWGMFRLAAFLLRGSKAPRRKEEIRRLPPADPYYEVAMRELDRELGEASR
jgi:hypothetical protein